MAMNLDALLRIKASVSGEQSIKQLGRSMEGVSGKIRNIGNSFESAGKSLEVFSRGLAALAAGQAIRSIVQGAAQFDQAVRTAAAIASSGGGDFQGAFNQLKTEIESVASAAAGTPTEVANLAVALQRAGFSVTETSQSLRGIVAGAEATSISFEEMGSITADTLRQFGLDTTQTMRVVDLLTDAANSANQKVQDVGEAMKYAAPIAKNLGVSVEDTAATIALLAEAGIRGSDAGTALRTGLTRLQIAAGGADSEVADLTRGNKQLTEAMSVLGSQILDTEGKLKPLDQVIMGLKAGMDGLSATDQAVLAKALFGMEAGSKFIALINQSSESIQRMFGDMRDSAGEATETQKKMQGFAYSVEVLNGNVQNVSNSIGNQFMAAMKPAVDIMNKMLSAANDLPDPTKEFAAQLAAVGLAAGAVTLALRTLIPLLRTFVGLMGALKIGGLLAAGPWFALAAGIAAVAVALNNAANAQQAFDRTMATGSLGDVRKQVMKLQEQVAADQEALDRMEAGSREQAFAQARLDARKAALEQARAAYRQRLNQPAAPKAAAATAPPVPMGATPPESSSKGAGKSEAEKAAEKAAKEAERLAEQTAQQLKSAQDLQFTQANQLLQLRAKNDFERAFVEFGIKRSEIERKYNELLQQSKSAEEIKLLQQARAAEYKQSSLILEQRSIELTKQAAQPLDDILKNLQDQAAYQREYGELIKNGTNPELAKQIIEINRAYEASVAALEPALAAAQAAVTKAEAEGASATQIEKYRKELERIQEIRGGLEGKRGQAIGAAKEGAAKQPTVLDGIGERIKQLQAELDPIKLATDSIVSGADAIGQAFGQAFQDVATGAKSTQQALADAFKGIGQAFISMAAEIIAKQMTLILLQTIFNALSGALGGGGNNSAVVPSKVVPVSQMPAGMAFAEGGYVTGPTQAVVGEGGQPEYIIPASKMRSAMQRYSAGARGDAVIPGNGSEPTAAGGGAAVAAPIDVRYTVERINSVDYVTADQFRTGMAQAAQQGATQGERRALATLRQNTSQRKRIGI